LSHSSSRYQAYISYAHTDTQFAHWLHRALESWRVPKRLVSRLESERIKPVFLDRSDLRAANDLGESLVEALENSSALIVICSEHAAGSKWVNMEIDYFRKCHGDERIFAIIAGGDPPACFPPALLRDSNGQHHEPIAGDARRGFDGRTDALLKTIAGLLDVEFDALKRRELRQRYRQMAFIAAGSFAGLVITVALAITAWDARNDANKRRTQADDLISFMLGDLRERLEPIGRLDVLNAVGDKSLAYFASLDDDEYTPENLLERARALRQIGEVRMSQGDLEAALEAFILSNQQAIRLESAIQPPDLVEFERSQSHFWIGFVHYERLEMDEARRHFEQYLALSEALLQREPGNTAYQTEVAYAHSNLGTLELKLRHFAEAEAHYRRTAAMNRMQVRAQPDSLQPRKDLAETLSWLGQIAFEQGDIDLARNWFAQEYELRSLIVTEVDDMAQLERLADAALLLAEKELLGGELTAAETHLQEAFQISHRLVEHDPDNTWWRRLRIVSRVRLSQVAAARGTPGEGLSQVDAARAEIDHLAQNTNFFAAPGRQLLIWRVQAQHARLLSQLNTPWTRSEVENTLESMSAGDVAGIPGGLPILAGLRLIEGDLHAREGRMDEAAESWQLSLEALDLLPLNYSVPYATLVHAALLERTGEAAQAQAKQAVLAELGLRADDDAIILAVMGVPFQPSGR
jgi:tetratricopeptide (TPR) repeat protein